jgi:hypothetical protein
LRPGRDESAHQDEHLRGGHLLRALRQRAVELDADHDIAGVQIHPQFDRFGLGFDQAIRQLRYVGRLFIRRTSWAFSPACPPHGIYLP